jgi:hypothetical protein
LTEIPDSCEAGKLDKEKNHGTGKKCQPAGQRIAIVNFQTLSQLRRERF